MDVKRSPIAVLGAGSWGTALALVLARNEQAVRLWDVDSNHVDAMRAERVNARYMPAYPLPDNITVYHDMRVCLQAVQDILVVVPSHAFSQCLRHVKDSIDNPAIRLAWGTKGLDPANKLLHEVAATIFNTALPMAVLAGPSYAREVAQELPTAVSLASNDDVFARDLMHRFHYPHFRIYRNQDMVGIELCGAVKNVLAIAAGVSDGLGLGANARCALITRGLAEMSRLIKALGGQIATVLGLAGAGDLILTCTDDQSRNRRFGLALGKGVEVKSAIAAIGQVVEGFYNAKQVQALAAQHTIEMPIVTCVYRILHHHLAPRVALQQLLERTPKFE